MNNFQTAHESLTLDRWTIETRHTTPGTDAPKSRDWTTNPERPPYQGHLAPAIQSNMSTPYAMRQGGIDTMTQGLWVSLIDQWGRGVLLFVSIRIVQAAEKTKNFKILSHHDKSLACQTSIKSF